VAFSGVFGPTGSEEHDAQFWGPVTSLLEKRITYLKSFEDVYG